MKRVVVFLLIILISSPLFGQSKNSIKIIFGTGLSHISSPEFTRNLLDTGIDINGGIEFSTTGNTSIIADYDFSRHPMDNNNPDYRGNINYSSINLKVKFYPGFRYTPERLYFALGFGFFNSKVNYRMIRSICPLHGYIKSIEKGMCYNGTIGINISRIFPSRHDIKLELNHLLIPYQEELTKFYIIRVGFAFSIR